MMELVDRYMVWPDLGLFGRAGIGRRSIGDVPVLHIDRSHVGHAGPRQHISVDGGSSRDPPERAARLAQRVAGWSDQSQRSGAEQRHLVQVEGEIALTSSDQRFHHGRQMELVC